jgi:hypothetical protein
MPNLQEHMLRVAGVASLITNNYAKTIDKEVIITAALLHDLGNMAKIKLGAFPEFAEPLGVKHWDKILTDFKNKYGNNDYIATYAILRELNIPKEIYNLVTSLEFAKAPQTAKSENLGLKICLYSDARVSPHGVVLLNERLDEVKVRYIRNKGVSEKKFNLIAKNLFLIEEQIFTHCKIKPEDITEEKVKPLFPALRESEIETKI